MTESDDTLTRLFAGSQPSLPVDDFLQRVQGRMQRERRWSGIKRITLTAAAVGLAIAATPYVAQGSIAVAAHLGIGLPAVGAALVAYRLRRAYQNG